MSAQEPDRMAAIALTAKAAWPHVASFIGAVLSLSFVEHLTSKGKIVAVVFGFFTATFVGPIAHAAAVHFAPFLAPSIIAPGLNFLMALAAMAILPPSLRALSAKLGDPEWVAVLLRRGSPQ